MVTDAAGTGFEIKKPHKGTETNTDIPYPYTQVNLKLRNPIRGRKLIHTRSITFPFAFEIKKPHKGTETMYLEPQRLMSFRFEIKKPHKGTETR